jgi:predicted Ser/Thr protein kinase
MKIIEMKLIRNRKDSLIFAMTYETGFLWFKKVHSERVGCNVVTAGERSCVFRFISGENFGKYVHDADGFISALEIHVGKKATQWESQDGA